MFNNSKYVDSVLTPLSSSVSHRAHVRLALRIAQEVISEFNIHVGSWRTWIKTVWYIVVI